MDEIEWMKKIKNIFKVFSIFIIVIAIILLIIALTLYILDGGKEFPWWIIQSLSILIVFTNIFLIILYGAPNIMSKLNNIKFNVDFNKEYIRELEIDYPPAIVSFIYDLKTEVYRDYTATILELYIKKYIDISGFNEEIIITEGPKRDIQNLFKHEVYVYNCIINKEEFNELKFKDLILNDAIEADLTIRIKQQDKKKLNTQLLIIVGLFCFAITAVSKNEFIKKIFSYCILGTILIPQILILKKLLESLGNESEYRLTSKSKKELRKIKAFKNFIKEYTLIKEKNIEYIQILEEYIPYSLSLGMSPQVEQYIKENEIYRNLIYKGKEQ